MKFSWHSLPKPFFVQAPMEDAADTVFRQMLLKTGRPDIFYTEFTNTEALATKGFKSAHMRLIHSKKESPIVAQIWGNDPVKYLQAIPLIKDMHFSGIDINMGCPVNKVVKKGFCSGLIQNPDLAKRLIDTLKENCADHLAVSVKTRIGYSSISYDWIQFLLEQNLDALTFHLRTTKEQSLVPAHWEEMARIVSLRNKISPHTILIGNGDIGNREEGERIAKETGVDGIMIGRGVLRNMWAFHKSKKVKDIPLAEKLKTLIDHIVLFQKVWKDDKSFHVLKKHYKAYINEFSGASELRTNLVHLQSAHETIHYIKMYLADIK